ncbi:MAG: zinc ribbon domain-containing protein [Planctomycetes bacterium]|nr:zinc ribbon domain-containing protein [Planctomycetota bacterium]MCB9934783.1 zinc ribbon domain-containing protein [Planctomycetota bacterium]
MPTYDYKCEACGHEFEEFQTMTAKALRKCPKCGKLKLKRLIGSGMQPIFKGSGFYETDYVKKSKPAEGGESKPVAKAEANPESKPAETKQTRTESKPASKK